MYLLFSVYGLFLYIENGSVTSDCQGQYSGGFTIVIQGLYGTIWLGKFMA
jgi:hypothetical protein